MLSFICFWISILEVVIAGMLDKIAVSIGVSISLAGQLVTAFALGNAIGTPLIIMITAKMNQRNQLLLGLVIILIGIIFILAFQDFGLLMASRFILGVGVGLFVVIAYSVAVKLASPGQEVGAMANIALGSSAAFVFGVPIGRFLATLYSWKAIFWIVGIFILLGIFAIMRTIPATESEAPISISKQLALLKNPNIAVGLCVTFSMFIGYSMVNTYITPFLTTIMPGATYEITVILFILGIMSVIGKKVGGFSADRMGISRTLIGGLTIQAISLLMISIFSGSVIVTIIWLLILTIGCLDVCTTTKRLSFITCSRGLKYID